MFGMREQELADRRIQREAVRPLPRGVHEHRARAVDHVARGHLLASRLQQVRHLAARAARDFLRSTEKIVPTGTFTSMFDEPSSGSNREHVLAALEAVGDRDDVRLFLRRHRAQAAAVIHRLDDHLVRKHVELGLDLALHVLRLVGAEDVGEAGAAHLVRDHLGGERHIVEDAGQLTRRLRVQPLLLDDVAIDRDDGRRRMLNHGLPRVGSGRVAASRAKWRLHVPLCKCQGVPVTALPVPRATHLSSPSSTSKVARRCDRRSSPRGPCASPAAPAAVSERRTLALGCPYMLPAPTDTRATRGRTSGEKRLGAARVAAVVPHLEHVRAQGWRRMPRRAAPPPPSRRRP